MKTTKFFLVFLMLMPGLAQAKNVLRLVECYRQALEHSETLAIDEQDIHIAEARHKQALGTILPHLNFNAAQAFQDTSGVSSGSPFGDGSTTKLAFTVEQPIFQGLREFKAMRVARAEKDKTSAEYERAKQLLFFDVAQAYYGILAAEQQLGVSQQLASSLQERLQNLKERVRVGRSRPNESLLTEAEWNAAEARVVAWQSLVAIRRDDLAFLTGQTVTQSLLDEFSVPSPLPNLQHWLDGLSERHDVKAAESSVIMAQGQIDYDQAAKLPALNLTGNYYPYRTGYQKDVDWDLALNLKVPLYLGGVAQNKVDEARAQKIQAEQSSALAKNQAEKEVREAYQNVIGAQRQTLLLNSAEKKAKASYELFKQDYELSQVDNIDVVDALKLWQSQKMESLRAFYETKLNYLHLLIASGKIPQIEEKSK